jgi:hypothetical protein
MMSLVKLVQQLGGHSFAILCDDGNAKKLCPLVPHVLSQFASKHFTFLVQFFSIQPIIIADWDTK